ncbi:MAG: TIGR03905 family TSCPD domain-containing protein [Clostridia bacterium]|nr:TIGR03905 family TSCPD domain-containing protein [Clostridia bacterium]
MATYKTRGVCSRAIEFEVENGVITACKFIGGCTGNTQGVAALVTGMQIDEAIKRLKGIQCRGGTSCPDQLAIALEQYKAEIA